MKCFLMKNLLEVSTSGNLNLQWDYCCCSNSFVQSFLETPRFILEEFMTEKCQLAVSKINSCSELHTQTSD